MKRRAMGMAAMVLVPAVLQAGNWGKNSLWNDGRAEVAVYNSERIVYGKPRAFTEHLITVKEDLREDTLVKADDLKKQKTIPVLKLNQVEKFDTENYPYSYLTSVFVKEAAVEQVVKLTVGSQEWCGNTFKIYKGNADGTGGTLSWNSYFDGEADQTMDMTLQKEDYLEDQLPLSLRALPFKDGFEKKIRVWDLLTTSHGLAPLVTEANLKVQGEEPIHCHAGSLACWIVRVQKAGKTDTYWFEKKEPNILVKMETSDGRKRLLYGRARWSYWDRRIPRPNILN